MKGQHFVLLKTPVLNIAMYSYSKSVNLTNEGIFLCLVR